MSGDNSHGHSLQWAGTNRQTNCSIGHLPSRDTTRNRISEISSYYQIREDGVYQVQTSTTYNADELPPHLDHGKHGFQAQCNSGKEIHHRGRLWSGKHAVGAYLSDQAHPIQPDSYFGDCGGIPGRGQLYRKLDGPMRGFTPLWNAFILLQERSWNKPMPGAISPSRCRSHKWCSFTLDGRSGYQSRCKNATRRKKLGYQMK